MKVQTLIISCVILIFALNFTCFAQDDKTASSPPPKIILISFDSFENVPAGFENAALDNFAADLNNDRNQIGYIIVYNGRRSCAGKAQERALSMQKYLVEHRRVEASRVISEVKGHLDKPHVLLEMQVRGVKPTYLEPLPLTDVEIVDCEEKDKDLKVSYLFNLIICLIVFGAGLYWLRVLDRKWQGDYRFLYRAFIYWWIAWAVWLVIWILKLVGWPQDTITSNIVNLAFTDLNAVCWILVYFYLTRGNDFRLADSLSIAITIILTLTLGYVGLYLYFRGNVERAAEIQQSLELCVGFVAAMLIGWAFALRYNTKVVFVVGYVYGFAQPFAFKAFFHAADSEASRKLYVVVLIVLAFLKLIWATVVTRYFLQKPETTENLVRESDSGSRSGLFQDWTTPLIVQTLALFAGFALLLFLKLPSFLSDVTKTIAQLVFFIGTLVGAVKLGRQWVTKLHSKGDAPKPEPDDEPQNKKDQ